MTETPRRLAIAPTPEERQRALKLGAELRKVRLQRGWSAAYVSTRVAQLTNTAITVDRATIGRIERAQTVRHRPRHIAAIAFALNSRPEFVREIIGLAGYDPDLVLEEIMEVCPHLAQARPDLFACATTKN